jgi:DNA-directed RNA polymerase subunit beta
VGELLANQCRVGLARTERLVKERMTLFDINIDGMTPQKLINPKALSAVIRDFLVARSCHNSWIRQSACGTDPQTPSVGAGTRRSITDRAGFEVRDVHPSHYGRICPIETPEGPNIGLISSMRTFARINEFGFIETPYRKVDNGRVTDEVDYLTGDREENYLCAGERADGREGISPVKRSRSRIAATSWKSSRQSALHGRVAEAAGFGRAV